MNYVIDLGIEIHKMIFGGLPKGGLKSIASKIGIPYKTGFDGLEVGFLISEYLITKDKTRLDWDNILKYNRKDLRVLNHLICYLKVLKEENYIIQGEEEGELN